MRLTADKDAAAMPVNFDFNDLYAFRALMEYGSFRLAAESICLSQSALSRRIEKLETALGNRLFDRTTRRVTLTLYGQNFAERSEQLLAHVETVLADISQVSKARTGLVTVATVPSAAYYFMPEIIRSFQARYPQVRIRLIDSSVGNVIEAVSSGQADFGLCFAKNLPASLEFTPLADDRYVAACRYDHPLARKTHLSWQAYFEQDYIGLDRVSGNRTLLDRELAHLTPARPSICETRHVTTMLGMVEAGIGIAALIAAPIGTAASAVGRFIMWATELQPFFMGIIVSVVIGVALTLPISSAAICAALGLTGLAGGAAVAGCCAQMIGFAVMSYKENGVGGLISQGLGTSMLQMGNIVKNPRIWIAPTLASAITGPLATCVFHMEMNGAAVSSGMGTCGLVGQIGVYTGWVSDIAAGTKAAITPMDWAALVLICFVLPAVLSVLFCEIERKLGWIKDGDLKLN